jgi:23S rRNA (cytidine2498-2'-O)-methyltransferase
MPYPPFIFATCQIGAEAVVKADLTRLLPACRFSFSRPGFLTFKLPEDHGLSDDFRLPSAFARSYGFCLGRVNGSDPEEVARRVWDLAGEMPFDHLHVFERDTAYPGDDGLEPAITESARDMHALLWRSHPQPERISTVSKNPLRPARRGRLALDCVLTDPGQCWVGFHRVHLEESRWPGGIIPLELPKDAVSRAWLKMEEALRWSRLPLTTHARVAEIGCAPGGASQALLDRGCEVLGIDPAEVDPRVSTHPEFTHVRRRARQVRRREFRKIRWLAVDMIMAPSFVLDAVEDIVNHPQVNVRGLLLTLKLTDWSLAEQLPEWTFRIRRWGYNEIRARQLAHNRQEICVAALMQPFRRKGPA